MVFNLKFAKSLNFAKECSGIQRTVLIGMRYWLLGLFWFSLLGCAELSASDGREFTVGDEQIISCDGAIAGAVLQADVDRVLSSVVLLMDDAPAPDGGFSVSLYGDSGDGEPGKRLSELTGPENPSAAGKYAYSPSGDVILEAAKKYWVVASVKEPEAAYRFQALPVSSEIDNAGLCNSFVRLGSGGAPLSQSDRY